MKKLLTIILLLTAATTFAQDTTYFLTNLRFVNAADSSVKIPPVANAGLDIVITRPTNTVTLFGSGTGTIISYAWRQVPATTTPVITNNDFANTGVTNLNPGVYQFELTVTDLNGLTDVDTVMVTVNNAANQAPTANAGADTTIVSPANSVTLSGAGSTDVEGAALTYLWELVPGGPGGGTFGSATSAITTFNSLVVGTYEVRLIVTDTGGLASIDYKQVKVVAPNNLPPKVTADASPTTIQAPVDGTLLQGTAVDPDGTIAGHGWIQLPGGPTVATFNDPSLYNPVVTGLVPGLYQFEHWAVDNAGDSGIATVNITVQPATPPVNQAPVANAGPPINRGLPSDTATIFGSGTDDVAVTGYSWAQTAGPSTATLTGSTTATLHVSALIKGTYKFELTVTDGTLTGKSTVVVTVTSANQAPTAQASGATVVLPTTSTTLFGHGIDLDGTIVSYSWVKQTGSPSGGTISNPTDSTTNITALIPGNYTYVFTVTDNQGATGQKLVVVAVYRARNTPPMVTVVTPVTITAPTSSTNITATGSDADGAFTYSWTKQSGGPATIVSPTSGTTSVTGLTPGVYQFKITVTDDSLAIASAYVNVTVNAAASTDSTGYANANGKNYYVAPWGNSGNSGTDVQHPWTLAKVNSSWSIIAPGDSVLFRSGQTFTGHVTVGRSGTAAKAITLSHYGPGANPLFSGFQTISSWTSVGSGVYKATVNAGQYLNMVTLNAIPQRIGRTPNYDSANGGYRTYETFNGTASITDDQAGASPNWVGADLVVRKNQWMTEKLKITAQSGGTYSYGVTGVRINPLNASTQTILPGSNGFGYFLQNDIRTLDQLGEWFYSGTDFNMYFGGGGPTGTVRVATTDTLINIGARAYITVSGIDMEGCNIAGVYAGNSAGGLNVNNCTVTNSGGKGVLITRTPNVTVTNVNTRYCLISGIDCNNKSSATLTIANCHTSQIGIYPGMGSAWDDNDYKGITGSVTTTANIQYNRVDTTGYGGIQFQGNNVNVQYNVVNYYGFVKADIGGIYTFASGTDASPGTVYTNRLIANNIIHNSGGAPLGAAGGIDIEGIYLDGRSMGIRIENNTVYDVAVSCVYCNNPHDVSVYGNTGWNNGNGLGLTRYDWGSIANFSSKKNVFYSDVLKTVTGNNGALNVFQFYDGALNTPATRTIEQSMTAIGTIDSNYYRIKKTLPFFYYYQLAKGGAYTYGPALNFADWKAKTSHDLNSNSADATKAIIFQTNETNQVKTITFTGTYKTPAGILYTGSAPIQPYSSFIGISQQ